MDETRLQYIISAISELEDIHAKSKDLGLQQHESNKKSQRSDPQCSNRPQKGNIAAPDQRVGDSLEASSSQKAVEVSVFKKYS